MEAQRQSLAASTGLLILRLGIGGYMASHGWGKLRMLLNNNFEMWRDPIGVGDTASLALAVFGEFVCPLLVMIGLATRLAAVPTAITMAVAAFVVHANDPWTMGGGASKEPALLYLIPFLALIFTGPGRLSIDAWIAGRWRSRRGQRKASAT